MGGGMTNCEINPSSSRLESVARDEGMTAVNTPRLQRISEKVGVETNWKTLARRLQGAVEVQDWTNAADYLALIWCQDWTEFLGRDSAVDGNDSQRNGYHLCRISAGKPESIARCASKRALLFPA